MGQRVNIILIVEDKEGKKKVTVYHDQWGIGRKSLLNLLSIHHSMYNRRYGTRLTDAVGLDVERSGVILEYEFHYDNEWKQDKSDEIEYPFGDFLIPEKIGCFIDSYCDNNNGAMVVHIKETDNGTWIPDISFKVGFLLGHEDEYYVYDNEEGYNRENEKYGEAFSKWLSLSEWCGLEINAAYTRDGFMEIIDSYMKYFEIGSF